MQYLDLTLPTPAENLALDEALLESAEEGSGAGEVLRLWEPAAPLVVVGRSSRVAVEVDESACRQLSVPLLRRCSGGAAIVTGPGCLMYGLVLSYRQRPELRVLEVAHRFVLGTLADAFRQIVPGVEMLGTSDLALKNCKFSGNSLRCKRDHLLYHGTILYNFPLERISQCLRMPQRQPDYRQQRDHAAFVGNFPATQDQLRRAVLAGWRVTEPLDDWPRKQVEQLVGRRYARADWNHRL